MNLFSKIQNLLISIGILFINVALAQVDTNKTNSHNYITLQYGVDFPIGSFGSYYDKFPPSNLGYLTSGFAKEGQLIDLSVGIPVRKTNSGIIAQLEYATNSLDNNSFITAAEQSTQPISGNSNATYSMISSTSYIQYHLMCGLFTTLILNKFSLNLSTLAGLLVGYSPEIKYSGTQPVQYPNSYYKGNWDVKSINAKSIVLETNVALNYNIANRFSFCINTGIQYAASVTFKTSETFSGYYNNGSNTPISSNVPYNYVTPMEMFNLSIGMSMKLF